MLKLVALAVPIPETGEDNLLAYIFPASTLLDVMLVISALCAFKAFAVKVLAIFALCAFKAFAVKVLEILALCALKAPAI